MTASQRARRLSVAAWQRTCELSTTAWQRTRPHVVAASVRARQLSIAAVHSTRERSIAAWRRTRGEASGVCPRCAGSQLRRSHIRWNWYERWRILLPSRPYQCQRCAYRIWKRPVQQVARTSGPAEMAFAMPETRSLRIDLSDLDASWESIACRNHAAARWPAADAAMTPSRIHVA